MRDDEARAALGQAIHRPLDQKLGARVDGAGRLVQNQHRRVLEHRTRDRQQLLLPGGIVRDGQLPVFGGFCQQAAEQKTAAFGLGHRKTSFAVPNGKTP